MESLETRLHDFRIEYGSLRSEDNESYKMMTKYADYD